MDSFQHICGLYKIIGVSMENFEKTLKNLSTMMRTKRLVKPLFDETVRYFEILDSKETSYQDKHFANVLA